MIKNIWKILVNQGLFSPGSDSPPKKKKKKWGGGGDNVFNFCNLVERKVW